MAFGPNEMRNYAYLRSLLDAYQQRVLEICSSQPTPEERFRVICALRDALLGKTFTLPVLLAPGYPECPIGQHCEGGGCVSDFAHSGWPAEGDPTSPTT